MLKSRCYAIGGATKSGARSPRYWGGGESWQKKKLPKPPGSPRYVGKNSYRLRVGGGEK